MEFPSVPMTNASTPAAPSAGTPARLGQESKPLTSQGSGKSFSSVLHSVSDQQHHEDTPAASDGDAKASADQASSSTPTKAASDRDGTGTDRPVNADQSDEKPVAAATTPEPVTQALLLALVATPVTEATPQPVQNASSSGATAVPNQEAALSAMSVRPEGTVAADASSKHTDPGQTVTAQGERAAATTAPQVAVTLPSVNTITEQVSPGQETQITDQPEAGTIPTAQESREARKTEQKDTLVKDAQTAAHLASVSQVQEQSATPEKAPVSVPQQQARTEDSEPVQPTRDPDRPATQFRSEPSPEPVQSEKEPASHGPVVTAASWQTFADEQQAQGGPDLSNRERRDRQGEDVVPVSAGPAAAPTPAPGSYAGVSSGMADSKTASPAMPSAPAHAAPQAAMSHAVPTTDWVPEQASTQSRSVVLEVAQADLGRVNIRVAVNQDVVHAYFTSDRSEVGQFLANGQDKLQAALQNSGLDMGQFRVDIDRQSAGRSFQQQTPQGQNQWYESYRQGGSQGQGSEAAHASVNHRPGILNLVA